MKPTIPSTQYTIHPGCTKMYHNLKQGYQWNRMKKEIARYVSKCQTCQQMKAYHQRPVEKLQSLSILEWDFITTDFVVGLPQLDQEIGRFDQQHATDTRLILFTNSTHSAYKHFFFIYLKVFKKTKPPDLHFIIDFPIEIPN